MDAIPPDIAKKLLNRDFANLVKRVQAGGKINRTERAMLQSMASGAGGDGPAYVRNFVELAVALKVSRQTINGWKKFEDAPKPEANGLHDVAKWREFMRARGLKVVPLCPFTNATLRKHPEWQDVLKDPF